MDGRIFEMKKCDLEKVGCGGSLVWTLGVVDFSGKSLCSLDTCHHLDASQN